jgi:hypothetical protein
MAVKAVAIDNRRHASHPWRGIQAQFPQRGIGGNALDPFGWTLFRRPLRFMLAYEISIRDK